VSRKTEPPLAINMPTDEALARFIQTDPREVEASIVRSKQAKAARVSPGDPVKPVRPRRPKA